MKSYAQFSTIGSIIRLPNNGTSHMHFDYFQSGYNTTIFGGVGGRFLLECDDSTLETANYRQACDFLTVYGGTLDYLKINGKFYTGAT